MPNTSDVKQGTTVLDMQEGFYFLNRIKTELDMKQCRRPNRVSKDNFSQRVDGVSSAGVLYERLAGVALATPVGGSRVL